jgi:hypothetical protein
VYGWVLERFSDERCIGDDSSCLNGMNGCQLLLDNYPLQSEPDKVMMTGSFDVGLLVI